MKISPESIEYCSRKSKNSNFFEIGVVSQPSPKILHPDPLNPDVNFLDWDDSPHQFQKFCYFWTSEDNIEWIQVKFLRHITFKFWKFWKRKYAR